MTITKTKTKTVVVVDDDLNALELLEYNFTKLGFITIGFSDSSVADHYLKTIKVDAIVTDWMMPHIDGCQLVESLKDTVNQSTVKIMISCISDGFSIARALQSGVDFYYPKPLNVKELGQKIQTLLLAS